MAAAAKTDFPKFSTAHFLDFLGKAIPTVAIVIFFVVLNELIFRRLYKEREKSHLLFVQRCIRIFLLIFLAILLIAEYWGMTRLINLIAGSVAIIGAVIGFAAQSMLRDFLAGLMISIYRPFDIGDRLLLDSVELPAVVEELTMRHTVLKTMDGIRYVIPNSEIGSKVITNTSYRQSLRGTFIKVPIGYDTDIPKAIHVMREAVRECPYTLPNNKANEDLGGYGDVYLMGFEESALTLETVIWTDPSTDNFLACTEVRMAIIQHFRDADIEIPYNYLNLIEVDEMQHEETMRALKENGFKPKKRNARIKTDAVDVSDTTKDLKVALDKIEKFASYMSLSTDDANTIRLLTEELFGFSKDVTGATSGKFWVEGNRNKVNICLKTKTEMDSSKRKELMDISSTGKNDAISGFMDKIREMITIRNESGGNMKISYSKYKEKNGIAAEDLGKAILTSLSDDIRVAIYGNSIEITVRKNFR